MMTFRARLNLLLLLLALVPLAAASAFSYAQAKRNIVVADLADEISEDVRPHMQRIQRGAAQLEELISGLLVVSRIGRAELATEWVDNGIGFDPKYAERVFGVFDRLHDRDSHVLLLFGSSRRGWGLTRRRKNATPVSRVPSSGALSPQNFPETRVL